MKSKLPMSGNPQQGYSKKVPMVGTFATPRKKAASKSSNDWNFSEKKFQWLELLFSVGKPGFAPPQRGNVNVGGGNAPVIQPASNPCPEGAPQQPRNIELPLQGKNTGDIDIPRGVAPVYDENAPLGRCGENEERDPLLRLRSKLEMLPLPSVVADGENTSALRHFARLSPHSKERCRVAGSLSPHSKQNRRI
ncbi:MAG: hypothetical protein EOL87_11305 [Spartobacteria bacterium]|nr:hypothetical protein [Spartobacteria bacterium]